LEIRRSASDFPDDDSTRAWLAANLNAYTTVLRPRLEALLAEHD
jgi:hypothetical protein